MELFKLELVFYNRANVVNFYRTLSWKICKIIFTGKFKGTGTGKFKGTSTGKFKVSKSCDFLFKKKITTKVT